MEAKFIGRNLPKLNGHQEKYNFLGGKFGKEILKEYFSVVKKEYDNNPKLSFLNFADDVVKSSNIYSVVLVNKILSEKGLRTSNLEDIQKIISHDEHFLRGFYVNLGVVLRNSENPNQYIANRISKQSREKDFSFSNSNPLIFKSSDLELIFERDSPSGLGFKIKDDASPFNSKKLTPKYSGRTFNLGRKNGVPRLNKYGKIKIYSKNNGLSKIDFVGGSLLYSTCGDLSDSGLGGRIVILG